MAGGLMTKIRRQFTPMHGAPKAMGNIALLSWRINMIAQLTAKELSELRVLLMMQIASHWKMRRFDMEYYRQELRFAVKLLRKLRSL